METDLMIHALDHSVTFVSEVVEFADTGGLDELRQKNIELHTLQEKLRKRKENA